MASKTIALPGTAALTFRQHFTGHKARGGGPGGTIWPCGESLAHWLAAQCNGSHADLDEEVHRALSSGSVKSVLELGCGTGVVGLTLSQLGVPQVVATDGDPASVLLCESNAEQAGLSSRVTCCQLAWGEAADDMPQLKEALARCCGGSASGTRCAQWIVGGDVVYHAQSSLELEVTIRELVWRGGCSLIVIGWCERGQQAESFLRRLSDLGSVRTAFRERDAKYSFLSRRGGRLITTEVEFGVSLLSVHAHITAGHPNCGWPSSLHQRCAILYARLASLAHACLSRCRTLEQIRAEDRDCDRGAMAPLV